MPVIRADVVYEAVKTIVESGRGEEFVEACRQRKMSVNVNVDDFEFVIAFLKDGGVTTTAVLSKVMGADTCVTG